MSRGSIVTGLARLPMPTRVLIVGPGGREDALAWKLAAEPGVNRVVSLRGTTGSSLGGEVSSWPAFDPNSPERVLAAAKALAAELVVIGPENPLAAGVVDVLGEAGVAAFGPTRAAARIEASKSWCHDVAAAAGVAMARSASFAAGDSEPAIAFARTLDASGHGVVLKADGLAAGKGVVVAESLDDAIALIPRFLAGEPNGHPALVVEDRLEGDEVSVIAICDGKHLVGLPAARDHKRLLDGDLGPNTGGMGAYSPVPDLDDAEVAQILETVHRPLLAELARRGTPFTGFLYAGLMLTEAGPVLLECNARLGDPEAQAILPRLATAIGPLLLAAARGAIPDQVIGQFPVLPVATVAVTLAAPGYPAEPQRGAPISGLDDALAAGALVFHAGTLPQPQQPLATNGGRVLTVVGRGPNLEAARAQAEMAADLISWPGMQRRHDIALRLPAPLLRSAS